MLLRNRSLELVAVIAAMFAFSPAYAAHCGHGKIYRVSRGVCVGIGTRLALEVGYGHHYHRVRMARAEETTTPHQSSEPTPRHRHHHRHEHCDPLTQCGDPIEDKVEEEQVEPEQAAVEPVLPDPFGKSKMKSLRVNWWMGK